MPLYSKIIASPLGEMLAICDDQYLHLLEFENSKHVDVNVARVVAQAQESVVEGDGPVAALLERELVGYFAGQLKHFSVKTKIYGSDFQLAVMKSLMQISFGQVRSYAQQAQALGKSSAVRAVASANGRNQIAIVLPCHRVLGSDGKLRGYAGGLERKQWLLQHEQLLKDK